MIDVLLNLDLSKNEVTNLPELHTKPKVHIRTGICIGRMPEGTVEGASTVMIMAKLPSGEHVVLETSLKLFAAAADVFRAADKDANVARGKAAN